MTVLISTTFKNDTLASLLRAVSNTYAFYYGALYTGAMPASGDAAATGTLLHINAASSAYLLSLGSWGFPSNGVVQLANPEVPVSITAAGVPGYLSLTNQAQTLMMYLSVGIAGSGAGCILSSTSATSIGVLAPSITDLSFSWPDTLGTVKLNTTLRNALCNMWCNTPAGLGMANGGSIKIYSGSPPATADLPATGTLLATFTTSNTTWATPSGGTSALSGSLAVSAAATGTAEYARFSNSAGTWVMQMSVGTSGADLTMDSLSLVAATTTTITNATMSI